MYSNRRGIGAAGAVAGLLASTALTATALAAAGSGGIGTDDSQQPIAGATDGTFPVRGSHTYGDGLGAGRNHQGQDVLAKCGRAVVAAQPGRVEFKDYQASGGGNYVVVDGKRDLPDTVYMHMSKPAKVREGQRISAGELIGRVGSTGRSTACHLHFEMWSPGWGKGRPLDPEPHLRSWDRRS